jgi:hypothetical protein
MEAIIWKSIEYKNQKINNLTTSYAIPFIIALEPLVALIGTHFIHNEDGSYGVDINEFLVVGYIILALVIFFLYKRDEVAYESENGLRYHKSRIVSLLAFLFFLILPFYMYIEDNRLKLGVSRHKIFYAVVS